MTQATYYSVVIGKRASIVKYAQSPDYSVKLFSGSFDDPGQASQQFKIAMDGKLEYLAEAAFLRKVEQLSTRYKQDLAKLAAWNDGKAIRI
jgi:hypothetical protein